MDDKLCGAIDTLCAFLARRDVSSLTGGAVRKELSIDSFDVLLVFGNDVIEVIECAARAYRDGLAKKLLFSGGVGHGTAGLIKNVKARYGIEADGMAEGGIMAVIAAKLNVPKCDIIIENRSANSGENAKFSLELLAELGVGYRNLLLMQDPLMQLRSHLTLKAFLGEGVRLVSYAPFIPMCADMESGEHWDKDRFIDLLNREIPRLRDDENGYGPNGAGYIEHCGIPVAVEDAYGIVVEYTN